MPHPLGALACRVLVVVVIVAAVPGLSACDPARPRVLVYGDSLTVEAWGAGDSASILSAYAVDWYGARFMTAPCNALALTSRVRYRPDVVVINYSGNHGSYLDNCMAGETGQALAERYARDVQTLIDRYRNGTTRIVIIGAPARRPELANANAVFFTMVALAVDPHNRVAFFDGGRFITPGRQTTTVAPCLSRETGSRCGTAGRAGWNAIRDPRHDHLCPTGADIDGRCRMYSSGSVRLALNIRDAIAAAVRPLHPTAR